MCSRNWRRRISSLSDTFVRYMLTILAFKQDLFFQRLVLNTMPPTISVSLRSFQRRRVVRPKQISRKSIKRISPSFGSAMFHLLLPQRIQLKSQTAEATSGNPERHKLQTSLMKLAALSQISQQQAWLARPRRPANNIVHPTSCSPKTRLGVATSRQKT